MRTLSRFAVIGLACGWLLAVSFAPARASNYHDFEKMWRLVPGQANALLLIDAEGLFASPLGQQHNWKKKLLEAYVSHGISLPPDTVRVMVAASLNPTEHLRSEWKLGVLDLSRPVSLTSIARDTSGTLDTLGTQEAVLTRTGRFVVKLAEQRVAAISADNRQTAARWLRSTLVPADRMSPFLRAAAAPLTGTSKVKVLMALDLQDAITPEQVQGILAEAESLKGKKYDAAVVTNCLASLKGVVLTVSVDKEITGDLRVEFGESASVLTPFAKPLLLEILAKFAGVDDLEQWTPHVEKSHLTLQGSLTASGLRQILSIVEVPTGDVASEEPEPAADPEKVKADATQKYFTALNSLITDVRRELKNTREDHASWSERYAEKIDQLPVLNVDTDLLTYAGNVSGSLRYQAVAKRSAGIRKGVRNAQPVYATNTYYGPFGGYAWETHRDNPDRTRIGREEMARYQDVRMSEWQQIDAKLVEIRRTMTQRYMREFQ